MSLAYFFPRYKIVINKAAGYSTLTADRKILSTVLPCTLGVGPRRLAEYSYLKWQIVRGNSNFRSTELRPTASFLDISSKIFKSPVADIEGFSGVFLHECVWKNVDKWWTKIAVICAMTGRSYTYGELRKLSGKFATSLRKNNILPGDTIAAILPNVPEYAILVLGASEAGVKVTLINPAYTAEEIKKQLDNSETVAVVTVAEKYPTVAESIRGNSAIRLPVIVINDGTAPVPPGIINFKDLMSDNVEEFAKTGMMTERDPNVDTAVLPYSSGTTGLPKGVELTHKNLVVNIRQVVGINLMDPDNDQHILPLILPIFHIYGLVVLLASYLSRGAKLITIPQFSPNVLLEVFEKNKVSILYVAPPLIQLLANDPRFEKKHLESVKFMLSGAAPMGEQVIVKFLDRFGSHINFAQGYGLTETSPGICSGLWSTNAPVESNGILVPNTQVRIVGYTDENVGKNLGINEIGEIYIKGPQVMKGYYKNIQATKETMDGDWFKTGDLGAFDDQGNLYIHGRLKELIKVQGFQVAPAEIEDAIQGHEKVADAAVIGIPHERYGEVPKAFVVPKPGMNPTEAEIKDYVSQKLAKYKHLHDVVFIKTIPKSAAGKILRRELQKF